MENDNFFQKDNLFDLNNNLNNIYNSNNNNNIINTSSTQNIDDGTQVDIKIPKPYPKAINENKKYNNKIENNNLKKQNKNLKEQKVSNNLNYKNITNKINDFNLKVIDFNPQEIEINKINNLEESIDLINKLKEKCFNFQKINNINIENSTNLIYKLKEQNQLYLNKINELYDTLDLIEKNFDIDINHLSPNDAVYINIKNFREFNLKKNFFKYFKHIFYRNKYLKEGIIKLKMKKEMYLKLKSFIGFEKMININNFKKILNHKRKIKLLINGYRSIKDNAKFNKLERKFYNYKKYLNLLFCIKNFKLQAYLYKIKKHNTQKALLYYYLKTTKKVLKILNYISLYKSNNQKAINNNNKIKINYIKFINYISNKYKDKFNKDLKFNKIKELTLINKLFKKKENDRKKKFANNLNKKNILKKYFDLWNGNSENKNLNKINFNLNDNRLKQFYKNTLDLYKTNNNFDVFENNFKIQNNI